MPEVGYNQMKRKFALCIAWLDMNDEIAKSGLA